MCSPCTPLSTVLFGTLSLWRNQMLHSPAGVICQVKVATHKAILSGAACQYHLLDWRSFLLPRVARSMLSAEGQAAAEAADNLHFVVSFWHAILDASYRIDGSAGCFAWLKPCILVIDANCLYDILHREELIIRLECCSSGSTCHA